VPRRKPDEVIVHRIELGVYERERLDLMVAGNVFNKVSNPIVNLLSDVSGLAALVGILEAVGVLNIRKYIKANTPLDEWANSVIGGLFSGFDEAMAALDTAFEQTRMLISEVEGIEIPSIDIPTTEDIGRGLASAPGEVVEYFLRQSYTEGKRYLLMGLPDKTALGIWAWAKTTVQNAPPAPSWVPEWPSGRWST
jgi:hypothetical protein